MRTDRRRIADVTILPSAYTKLRYISTEREYSVLPRYNVPFILTDIKATLDTKIEMKLLLYKHYITSDGYIWGYNIAGGYAPGNDTDLRLGVTVFKTPTTEKLDYAYYSFTINDIISVLKHEIPFGKGICDILMDVGTGTLRVNFENKVIKSITPDKKPTTVKNRNISLMTSTPYLPPFGDLYGARIYQKNVLVCDLKPVKRKSDGMIGMYDLVSRKFYTSPNGMKFSGGVRYKTLIVSLFEPAVAERRVA